MNSTNKTILANRISPFKMILATILSATTMWLVAGLWHTVIAIRFYEVEASSKHEGVGIIFMAYLILGGLMAYIYQFVFKANPTVIMSLLFGALIGLLWVFPHELAMAGAHGESLHYVFKNAVWHIVEQCFGGLVMGWIFRSQGALELKIR